MRVVSSFGCLDSRKTEVVRAIFENIFWELLRTILVSYR